LKNDIAENKTIYLRKIDEQNERLSECQYRMEKAELDFNLKKYVD